MDWSNERYVRIYTRKTAAYLLYPWQSRAIRDIIFKDLDRAGVLECGDADPVDAVAAVIMIPREVVEVGLPPLLNDETFILNGSQLVNPNYIDAQEAKQSDKARAKKSRETRRAVASLQPVTKCDDTSRNVNGCDSSLHGVTERDASQGVTTTSQNVTDSHETNENVTHGHTESHGVTPCRALLNRAVPKARAREDVTPEPEPEPPPKLLSWCDPPFVWQRVISCWIEKTGLPVDAMSNRDDAEAIARQCQQVNALDPFDPLGKVFDNWLADDWVKKNRPGLSNLRKNFQKYIAETPKADGRAATYERDAREAEMRERETQEVLNREDPKENREAMNAAKEMIANLAVAKSLDSSSDKSKKDKVQNFQEAREQLRQQVESETERSK